MVRRDVINECIFVRESPGSEHYVWHVMFQLRQKCKLSAKLLKVRMFKPGNWLVRLHPVLYLERWRSLSLSLYSQAKPKHHHVLLVSQILFSLPTLLCDRLAGTEVDRG